VLRKSCPARAVPGDKLGLSAMRIAAWTSALGAVQTLAMGKNLFFLALILSASGLISAPIALLGGLIYGFTVVHPFHVESRHLAKFLLQASVVALGFGMKLAPGHAGGMLWIPL
jgi:hypothetical protein